MIESLAGMFAAGCSDVGRACLHPRFDERCFPAVGLDRSSVLRRSLGERAHQESDDDAIRHFWINLGLVGQTPDQVPFVILQVATVQCESVAVPNCGDVPMQPVLCRLPPRVPDVDLSRPQRDESPIEV